MTFEELCKKINHIVINGYDQLEDAFSFLLPYWEAKQKVTILEAEIQHLKKVNKVQGLLLSIFRKKIKNLQNGN